MSTWLGIIASSVRKGFCDYFDRTTTGGLGYPWESVKGSWSTNGAQAVSNSDGSANTSAVVDAGGTSVTITSDVAGDMGLSFWVIDNNNWWGLYTDHDTTTSGGVTSYNTYLRVLSSVGGGTATLQASQLVASSTVSSPAVASLKLVVSESQVTAAAFSSSGQVNQMGSPLVFIPTGTYATSSKFGLFRGEPDSTKNPVADNFCVTVGGM